MVIINHRLSFIKNNTIKINRSNNMHLSASQLKTTLSNPTRTALRALGYKDITPNFKFAKGHAVEEYVHMQSKLEEIRMYYYKEKKYYLYSEIFKLGVELKHKEMQKDFKEN